MKNQILALPCLALFAAAIAGAQGPPPTKVGVIQVQAALTGTKDGQKAVAEFQSKMAPKQKEMERKRAEIQELQDKLSKGGNAMAQAAKDELARNIDTKTKSYNRDMEDAQAEFQGEERKMLEELSGKMQVVIEKYAQANNYTVLLDVSNQNTNVIWISTAIDVTKDIIDLYDKMNPGGPGTKPTAAPVTKPAAPATPPVAPKKQP
ncbi:MAG TPA: OmpH family outer membrane protein [Bryobacteraceae bacterium]|nr:OmpH family outer membrane protein [Bryobacteraceae bacterium]